MLEGLVHQIMMKLSSCCSKPIKRWLILKYICGKYHFGNFGCVDFQWKDRKFVFQRLTKVLCVWNDMRLSKWWQNFHFGVNCPFKSWDDGVFNSVDDVFLQRAEAAEREVEALREQLTSANISSPPQTRIDSTPYTVPALRCWSIFYCRGGWERDYKTAGS